MFLTDGDFRQALADTLKVDVAKLGSYWDRLCQQAHNSAWMDIRGALVARGFTAAQIDDWERGPEFERDIGLFWALVRGAGVHNLGTDFIDRLDRRKELETVMVETDAGTAQQPAAEPPRITYGTFSTTNAETGKKDPWTRHTRL